VRYESSSNLRRRLFLTAAALASAGLCGCSEQPRAQTTETTETPQTTETETETEAQAQADDDGWTYGALELLVSESRDAPFQATADLSDAAAFTAWQDDARALLSERLRLPERWLGPTNVRVLNDVTEETVRVREIDFLISARLRTPALLFTPLGAQGALPGVLLFHGHDQNPTAFIDAAREISERGFVVLVPQVRAVPLNRDDWHAHRHFATVALSQGGSVVGLYVADALTALDVLRALPEVDGERVGVGGYSLGGWISLLVAALSSNVDVAVVQSYLATARGALIEINHCPCQFAPGLFGQLDISDVALTISPRPLLFVASDADSYFPIEEVRTAFERVSAGYGVAGSPEATELRLISGEHGWESEPFVEWFSRLQAE